MWFESTYTLLGGLGLFFFGMKTLSESLQALSGNAIRRVIQTLTSNRFFAVAVGVFVTTLVQSSSVTTVMMVGLVNAGLMELTQAIGLIFGANIGTTITGWIIAIKVGKYGLLFVGLGIFPLLFSKRETVKLSGGILVALGFVFMGLEYMAAAFKPLRSSDAFIQMMAYFSADSVVTLLACVGIGAILTMVVQSSSAMLGITIALASTGSITFQTAVALVLGENIGTTITAILASVGANSGAKRAARAHATFNIAAVALLLPFFWHYLEVVDWVIGGAPDELAADGSKPNIAAHIAAAHTTFNLLATAAFLPFVNHLARFVTWMTPAPITKEIPHLKYLGSNIDFEAPALALAMADKELKNLAEITGRAVCLTHDYLLSETPDRKMREKILYYEGVTDAIQTEITLFLCRAQEARLTHEQAAFAYALIRAADELESIADYCASLVRARDRLTSAGEVFSDTGLTELTQYASAVRDYYRSIQETLVHDQPWNVKKFKTHDQELREEANLLRDRHRQRMEQRQCSPIAGMIFSDIIVGLRKVKAHATNIAETLGSKS